MLKTKQLIGVAAFLSAFFFSSFGKDITVTGTVVDTADNKIEGALVRLTSRMIGLDYDSVLTDADGKFSKKMTVRDNDRRISYIASKNGYQNAMGNKGIDSSSIIDLGKIVLRKGGGVGRTVTVTGRVVDSGSNEPIENARVVLSTINVLNPDTVNTNRSGRFSASVEIPASGSTNPIIIYAVFMENYNPKVGQKAVTLLPMVDLGTIKLIKSSVGINSVPRLKGGVSLKPNKLEIYTLKGQMIYSGLIKNHNFPYSLCISPQQPLIIRYKRNDIVLFTQKQYQLNK